MIRARLQIADGEILDTKDAYGLIFIDSDKRLAPDLSDIESSEYPAQDGANPDTRRVFKKFDYTVTLAIKAPNKDLQNANAKIAAFNKLLYSDSGFGDAKTFKQVTFYNDHYKVKIVGIPDLIISPDTFYRDSHGRIYDFVQVDWVIHVFNPNLCDWSI
jgi:hypothetical protein